MDSYAFYTRPHYELELLVAGLWGVFWAFLGVILFKKLTFSALVVGIVSAFMIEISSAFFIAAPLWFLSVLWFGAKLNKYGAWIWLFVIATLATGIGGLLSTHDVVQGYPSAATMALGVLMPIIVSIISLSIILLRAWALLRYLKLEEETAVKTHQSTLERIDREMEQLTQELALLDVKY